MVPNHVTPGPNLPSPTNMSDSSSDHEVGGVALDPEQVDMSDYPSASSHAACSSSPRLAAPRRRPSSSQLPSSTPNPSTLEPLHVNRPIASSSRERASVSRSPDQSQEARDSSTSPLGPSFTPTSDQENGQENEENIPHPSHFGHGFDVDSDSGNEPERGTNTGFGHDMPLAAFLGLRGWQPNDSLSHRRRSSSGSSLKRSREKFEELDEEGIAAKLEKMEAVATLSYRDRAANPRANDVWPNFRNQDKLPVPYHILKMPNRKEDNLTSRSSRSFPRNEESPYSPFPTTEEGARCTKKTDLIQPTTAEKSSMFPSMWDLPLELLEIICSYLNRDDIKSLRLVSKKINAKISQIIFKTVVVPFNTEIYGMLDEIQSDPKARKEASVYSWTNKGKDDLYKGHGLDVFRGFGGHILRFGMSFEVTEDVLVNAPKKTRTEEHTSFWGSYQWPRAEYCRFADVAVLETAADETPRMITAFSELSKVQELALSIDSGLGWMNGPDRSIRAQVLQKPPAVFGTIKKIPDRRSQAQQELWDYIEDAHNAAGIDVRLATLYKYAGRGLPDMTEAIAAAVEQPEMPFLDRQLIRNAVLYQESDGQTLPTDPDLLDRFSSKSTTTATPTPTGILFTSTNMPNAAQLQRPFEGLPNPLTVGQKEWLLETEWAQWAFVSSYMLSVIDNPTTFVNVHTLNIPRMSDRYISLLTRTDFWDALPQLKSVTLMVIPSFRKVSKDEVGFVETQNCRPTEAIAPFYQLLAHIVGNRQNITQLTIGWATGGEHAEGVHARNKLILPAPLIPRYDRDNVSPPSEILGLPFVEKLTLVNCWVMASTLGSFCISHDNLEHLILNSVSLPADERNWREPIVANPPLLPLEEQWQAFTAIPQHLSNAYKLRLLMLHIQTLQAHIHDMQELPGEVFQARLASLRSQLHAELHELNQQYSNLSAQNMPADQVSAAPPTVNLDYGVTLQYQDQVSNIASIFSQVSTIHQQLHPPQQQHQQPQHVLQHLPMFQQIQEQLGQNATRAPDPLSALLAEPLRASWTRVIDIITPGPNLSDFGSALSRAFAERGDSKLQLIEFVSCGYVRIDVSQYLFDRPERRTDRGIEGGTKRTLMEKIRDKRGNALKGVMLDSRQTCLGTIVQNVPEAELCALNAGWLLEEGWEDAEEAHAVTFDGLKPGGTGRITGRVRKEDKRMVQTNEESC